MAKYEYVIEYRANYGSYFSYIRKDNICELAKHINNYLREMPRFSVISVNFGHAYGKKLFRPSEYYYQYFYENYEDRLLDQYYTDINAV